MKSINHCLAAILVLLAGCGNHVENKVEQAAQKNPLEIQPRPEVAKFIKTGEAQWKAVNGTLTVAGRIEADETRISRITAPVSGRIVELEVVEGQRVKRGEVLATIHSTDLSSAQSTFLKACSHRQLAERAVSRAKQLLEAGVIGEAELHRRDVELQEANTELSSSREHLSVLGLSKDAIGKLETGRTLSSTANVLSTIDGIVLERKATIGQIVESVESMFTIADLSSVWLVADVPEQDAGSVQIGKGVEASIPALHDQKITGNLSFVSAIVNPQTRTVRVHMSVPNANHKLKPAMLSTITLMDGTQRQRVVPLSALVRESNEDDVFVETGPNRYLLRKVTLGNEFGALRAIVDGLRDGEKIVTEGAFHLNNERKRLALESSGSAPR